MSGGSFDYLCDADIGDIANRIARLREMANSLQEFEGADEARLATLRVIERIVDLESSLTEDIKAVWKAVEWYHSCDWGRDQAQAAVYAYRGKVIA